MPGLLEISSLAHQQFLDIQKQLFEGLDIHFKVLDMPPDELGHPAYRKYDIEVSVEHFPPNRLLIDLKRWICYILSAACQAHKLYFKNCLKLSAL